MQDKISVLIIEDEVLIAENIKLQLEDFGYNIAAVCYKYETALNAIEQGDYDIVLTDINLGHGSAEKSGINLVEKLKQIKQCPFIFLTAFADKETIQNATALYPAAYLVKPTNAGSLYAALQVAIENNNNKNLFVANNKAIKPDYFFIKLGNKLIKIFWQDVYYLEALKNYVSIKTPNYPNGLLIRGSLQQVMQVIMPENLRIDFVKINRAQAISKKSIIRIDNDWVETPFGVYKLSSDIDKKQL